MAPRWRTAAELPAGGSSAGEHARQPRRHLPRPRRGRRLGPIARRGRRLAPVLALAAFLGGCSFDYGSGPGPEQLAEQVPETILTGVAHTVVRGGRLVAEIHAAEVENFPRDGRAVLHDVQYTEFDGTGAVVASGRADRAVYYTDSEDAEVAGAVELRSASQEASLSAEALRWDKALRLLSSDPDQMVTVSRDDGAHVQGAGLEVEVRRKTIRFSGPVRGLLVAAPR